MRPVNCHQAREALWPPERLRVADDTVLAARRHVDDCEACRSYLAQDPLLLDAYDEIREIRAPAALRERVFDVLATERARERKSDRAERFGRRSAWWIGGSVALAAASVSAVLLMDPTAVLDSDPAPVEAFVEDYMRRAVGGDRIATSDPMEVSDFLMRELGISHTPISYAGLVLTGAEVCFLEGRRGAMVLYEKEGRALSHYLIPHEGLATRAPKRQGDPGAAREPVGSPSVVTWATPALEQALVGSFRGEALMEIADVASR